MPRYSPSNPAPAAGTALVTGCAGFLGSHLVDALLASGWAVHGLDAFTRYYAREHKVRNLRLAAAHPRMRFTELDLATADLSELLDGVDTVFHLAAQPGVRRSFGDGLREHLANNVTATQRLLEQAARADLDAFVYASSSSVYGDQPVYPVAEHAVPLPVSPYGATKVITEQLAGAFWRSHGVPVVGMRYFTVYGPRQRPDMAFSRFVERALDRLPLPILGDGLQQREFTYVADVVEATIAAARTGERGSVYNVGGGAPVTVLGAIEVLERLVGRALHLDHRPSGPGDPRCTHADVTRARRDLDFVPRTGIRDGMAAQLEAMTGDRVLAGEVAA